MTSDSDRIYSEFVDAWNAGERPDVDDYLARVGEPERASLAGELAAFLTFAPTPPYDERALREIRADPVVAEALAAARDRAGLLPALLRRRRERLRLSPGTLAERVAGELGLAPAQRAKAAAYLERWERGELESRRVSRRVFEALAGALGVARDELERAADAGSWAAAPAFRSAAPGEPAAAPYLETLADALATPGEHERDEIDELFLGGR